MLENRCSAFAVYYLLLFLIVAPISTATAKEKPAQDSENKLTLLNWSEYLDPDVLKDFEKKHGIQVTEVYYETDEMRSEILVNNDGKGFDMVVCNGPPIAQYAKRNWLAKIPNAMIPNMKNVDPRWKNAFPKSSEYAVPFLWGTLGIAYRSDIITHPVTGWKDIFKPQEALRGKIVMIKDSRDLLGMALKSLGHSANSMNPNELVDAKKLLLDQKPYVKTYSYISLGEKSSLVTGEALMAMVYNGDALMVQEHEQAIKFVQPEEGGNIWCDYFLLLKSSSKKDMAYKFLNYIHEPEVMAKLAQFAYYATTNTAAEKILPKDFLSDPIIYPPKQVLEKSETYSALPPRTVKKYNSIFNLIIQ